MLFYVPCANPENFLFISVCVCGRELLKFSSEEICISSEENFFLLYISQVQIKKKKKTFASYKKIRTFASRLLSRKDKHLIHSELISLCPRWLIRGEAKHLVVTFKKTIKSGYFKLQDHFCKQSYSD